MRYKVSDTELEVNVNGWPTEWWEPINIAEVSTEKSTDAPKDLVWKYDQQYTNESLTETPTDLEAQRILQEIRKKRCIDHVVNNNTMSAMEAQLHQLVKVVNYASDAVTKEMKK